MTILTDGIVSFDYLNMASKRIIISSEIDSLQEVIDAPVFSYIFTQILKEDLANKIRYVSLNYDPKMVKNGFENVKEYSWEKRAKHIKSFLSDYSNI